MKILVIGATGLIGSSVAARLQADGHYVVGLVRPGSGAIPSVLQVTIRLDLTNAGKVDDWRPSLTGIEAVVNCAGVLQDSPRERTEDVHNRGAAALFKACEELGIRRVIHFSALGVDREQPSNFSLTKLRGDQALKALDLDWVILRPSVVLGRPAFGASALFRGLAALPLLPAMPGGGELQVVQLQDVVSTAAFFVDPAAPSRLELELAGPERLTVEDVVALYRRWLGWPQARVVFLPSWVSSLLYRAGDLAGRLGWRPPMRSTAQKEIARGATGDPSRWMAITDIVPASLSASLAAEPASVQERWFAKLYFIKPVLFIVLAVFWIATGLISLSVGYRGGIELMLLGGAGSLSGPSVIAGALADIAIGAAIAFRPTTRMGIYAAIALSIFYAAAGSLLLPELWNDPLGPLLKIGPILVLHMAGLAILNER